MPPRAAPTARQRRLGTELRKMRDSAGMTAPQAAEHLGTNRTGISNMEAGRFGISEERVRTLANIYACPDQAYIDALASMAEERGKGWWEEYRGKLPSSALDMAELEHHATGLRALQIMHVPGLLQTEEYAKAVLSLGVPKRTQAEIRRRLSFRMKRRDVLDRENPPQCIFLIHEAALRMQFGGPKVARGQLEYLLEASERDNISVRVIPFSAGGFPHAGSSVFYASAPVQRLATVYVETAATGSSLLDAETHLANYRAILDEIEEVSLTPEDTREFIRDITHKL